MSSEFQCPNGLGIKLLVSGVAGQAIPRTRRAVTPSFQLHAPCPQPPMVTLTTGQAQARRMPRRQQALRGLLCSMYRNRRTDDRRSDIRWRGHYVDSHRSWLLVMAVGVMLLSIVDAYFTLLLLQLGAEEINPFLNWLLNIDHQLFFVVKLTITGFCIVWLVMHQRFRVFGVLRVYQILVASLLLYLGLIYHQLNLLQALSMVFA